MPKTLPKGAQVRQPPLATTMPRRPLPLALTDDQIRVVLCNGRLLPLRSLYLEYMAQLLEPLTDDCMHDGISDADVFAAASQALQRFGALAGAGNDDGPLAA
jgi:hypothetical protein